MSFRRLAKWSKSECQTRYGACSHSRSRPSPTSLSGRGALYSGWARDGLSLVELTLHYPGPRTTALRHNRDGDVLPYLAAILANRDQSVDCIFSRLYICRVVAGHWLTTSTAFFEIDRLGARNIPR